MSKRGRIDEYFDVSEQSPQQVLESLPTPKQKKIRFHSFSKSDGHSYLSNMFPCVKFFRHGLPKEAPFFDLNTNREFNSVEKYYQYHRFKSFDPEYAEQVILMSSDAKTAATASGKRT